MGNDEVKPPDTRTPMGQRRLSRGLGEIFIGVTRQNLPGQMLAGVTLLAIAIPEQLATSQLAGVPAFTAMIAFITATLVFVLFGSNPIVSVGADSTIAPLFAVALLRLALPASTQYLELVAATALVTGLALLAIGFLKLGWIADFLSLPIVIGFMCGIGVIIAVHQLPHVFGITGGGNSVVQRLEAVVDNFHHVSIWSIVLSLGTLVAMTIGEKINPRLPWALGAVLVGTILCVSLSLASHGVQELGTVVVGLPAWRLRWLDLHEWGVVCTTALTLVIVIMSQTAATARTSADELGVADDLSRDFVGVGIANVAAGLVGAFPVNASPARTTVVRLAGGRTKVVGVVAGLGALIVAPFAGVAHSIPLAALAGVLLFVAGRLIKIGQLRAIWHTSRVECSLAIVTILGVLLLGVEIGLALAVGLAILEQTWRSAHPQMFELGRRRGTTSWEPASESDVDRVDHVLAIIFTADIYFANAGVFRRELHQMMVAEPDTRHVVIDAAAISNIDYTGLTMLSQVVGDLAKDSITVSIARANEDVRRQLSTSSDAALKKLATFDSVDAAATAAAL
ncbi:MAG: SulP family inorganic anion transporter [Acidimicrobiales bacterium]|jgi:MFS superfamily sulfate permease-like transporter